MNNITKLIAFERLVQTKSKFFRRRREPFAVGLVVGRQTFVVLPNRRLDALKARIKVAVDS